MRRVLIVFKSYDLGSHCLEQSESEGAVQSLVERERKERRGKGRKGERKREMKEGIEMVKKRKERKKSREKGRKRFVKEKKRLKG